MVFYVEQVGPDGYNNSPALPSVFVTPPTVFPAVPMTPPRRPFMLVRVINKTNFFFFF